MNILQLTAHFYPNIGGVETHLNDLILELVKRKNQIFVLTYRPLINKTDWRLWERKKNFKVLRLPWIPGLFYEFTRSPILEFLYLFLGLFFVCPLIILWQNPDVIHSHGLVAGLVSVFWGKIFGKRVIATTHSIYNFPKKGLYRNFARWIFTSSNKVLCLSRQSAGEIERLGVKKEKIDVFTYWVDLEKFMPIKNAGQKLKWQYKFVVLYVGRLVKEKGLRPLLEACRKWNKDITLVIIGTGPLEEKIKKLESRIKNLVFLGKIDNDKLPVYYSASNMLIVPSLHEEGFGRVILESLACGTPVIGAKCGAIPEAMDETVGKLIKPNSQEIAEWVNYFYKNPDKLEKLAKNARKFAEARYSEKNVETIIAAYSG